jgi:hypothetical protein
MVGKQLHNRQTNGTENEKPRPAIPKPHGNRQNVYFTSKQQENIETSYKVSKSTQHTKSLPIPTHSHRKVSHSSHVVKYMKWRSC